MYRITYKNGAETGYIHSDAPGFPKISAGRLQEQAGTVPVLSCTLPLSHPEIQNLHDRTTDIIVADTRSDSVVFEGVLQSVSQKMATSGAISTDIVAEGYLTLLNDSVQMYRKLEDHTPAMLLSALLEVHNSAQPPERHILLGMVNVSGYTEDFTTEYRSTLAEIKANLIERRGGELRVRRDDEGKLRLDYLSAATTPQSDPPIVRLGKNMRSLSVSPDSASVITRLIPLGAKLDNESDERQTIIGMNYNDSELEVPYIEDESAVERYGIIYGTAIFDDITEKAILYVRGYDYLQHNNRIKKHYAATVIDEKCGEIICGNTYIFRNPAMGLDEPLRLLGKTTDLLKPYAPDVEIGDKTEKITTLAAETRHLIDYELPHQLSQTVSTAKAIASSLITAATTGFVVVRPYEILIMDTASTETATSVWRMNQGGIGYSHSDVPGEAYNGEYGLAMTMNGQIVADFIAAGTMFADRIRGGTLTVGGADGKDGIIQVLDDTGNEICRLDKNGAKIFGEIYAENRDGYWLQLKDGQLSGGRGDNVYTRMDATTEVTDTIDGHDYTFHGLRIWANAISFEGVEHIGVNDGSTGYIGYTGDIDIEGPVSIDVQRETIRNVAVLNDDGETHSYYDVTYVSDVTITSDDGRTIHFQNGFATA